MQKDQIQDQFNKIKGQWGEWTAHNIQLGPELYTVGAYVRGDEFVVKRTLQVAADLVGKPLNQTRVLDLGCLEGLYSVEFAKHGAEVVGIEVRQANLEKALFAKQVLNLDNLQFFQDDARNLSFEKYGSFDIVLCVGLLYHLDEPDVFHFIRKLKEVCRGVLILDTHFSLEPKAEVAFEGLKLKGHYYVEHSPTSTQNERERSLWASIDNQKSFWFSRESLFNLLVHIGFTSVCECVCPALPVARPDRFTIVAMAGKTVQYQSSEMFAKQAIVYCQTPQTTEVTKADRSFSRIRSLLKPRTRAKKIADKIRKFASR